MHEIRIGILLGVKQMVRANKWMSLLMICVVSFTFLNLVVIQGILLGITEGALESTRTQALSDITIEPSPEQGYIEHSQQLLRELVQYPDIASYSERYEELAVIEANYHVPIGGQDPDVIGVNIFGVDPLREMETVDTKSIMGEGEFLIPEERGYIVIGKHYIDRYAKDYGDMYDSLRDIHPGSVVRIWVGEESYEFTVKGIIDSKVDMASLSVFISEKDFRRIFNRADFNVNKILVRLVDKTRSEQVARSLNHSNISEDVRIKVFSEDIPKLITDVRDTFSKLSLVISSISVFVATITVFIIIFINVLSRRRQIGILKAIGVSRTTLVWAYVTQAACYGFLGIGIALMALYGYIIPYFIQNPIDFPYTYVSLYLTTYDIVFRAGMLTLMLIVAGYIPARMIIRQNTLNVITGRT
ncbi:MAG TPA: FtsX-like permease family protein [Candidatus Paceibacterota bacterium]|nr:FtsX-like permease family protein [Candidatus Paceibacterota bacterium]